MGHRDELLCLWLPYCFLLLPLAVVKKNAEFSALAPILYPFISDPSVQSYLWRA